MDNRVHWWRPHPDAASPADLSPWLHAQTGASVLALVPEAQAGAIPELQSACRTAGVGLVGGVFPAVLNREGFATDGVWLLRLPAHTAVFLLEGLDTEAAPAAQRIVRATQQALAQASGPGKPTLMLLLDGLLPHISSVLDALYLSLADRVDYAGANAGSETFQPMACLFDDQRCIGQGAVGLVLPPPLPAVLAHGFAVPEVVMSATATQGNCIRSIDWRPAFTVYQELIAAEHGISLTPDNFYRYAVHHPLGILRANGEVVVRIPVGLTPEGAVYCVGEVPENAMLVLLRAPAASQAPDMARLVQGLHSPATRAQPAGAPVWVGYCAGRRMHLGPQADDEVRALAQALPGQVLAGAVSLGEIGCTEPGGYPAFHNAAVLCLQWCEA